MSALFEIATVSAIGCSSSPGSAVIVGGTRLTGGSGSVPGALIGSLLMGMLNNGLILMGLSVSEQMIVRGCIILLAVAISLRQKST